MRTYVVLAERCLLIHERGWNGDICTCTEEITTNMEVIDDVAVYACMTIKRGVYMQSSEK